MDHHDDWAQWHEEPADFPDGDTADLPDLGHDALGDLHGHDTGYEDPGLPEHDPDQHDLPLDAHGGPDLLHESGDEHEYLGGADDLGPHPEPGYDDVHEDPVHDGYEPDQPAFADPDLGGEHDPGWHGDDFPPLLDLGHAAPDPVDGPPWSDPATLGDPATASDAVPHEPFGVGAAAHPDDLFAYSGMQAPGGDAWAVLLGSDDPATSSLARWWGPAA